MLKKQFTQSGFRLNGKTVSVGVAVVTEINDFVNYNGSLLFGNAVNIKSITIKWTRLSSYDPVRNGIFIYGQKNNQWVSVSSENYYQVSQVTLENIENVTGLMVYGVANAPVTFELNNVEYVD